MPEPSVSVIMSVYNGERYLREAIDSILGQTFADFEFIIINDGSTDSSVQIVRSYQDVRIRLINNGTNIGLTKSLNRGIGEARGKYIARQDADDISLPNRFEGQVSYLERHPEVALLGTGIYIIDELGKILRQKLAMENPHSILYRTNPFNHGSTMFRSEVVRSLGAYNELLRHRQDYELWLRIARYYAVRNLREPLYKLRFHEDTTQYRKRDEAALYHLLALRIARNEVEDGMLEAIKKEGINSLYPHLNRNEKIFYGKALAYKHLLDSNVKLARQEYLKIFRLDPFDVRNIANMIISYLGKNVQARIYRAYQKYF